MLSDPFDVTSGVKTDVIGSVGSAGAFGRFARTHSFHIPVSQTLVTSPSRRDHVQVVFGAALLQCMVATEARAFAARQRTPDQDHPRQMPLAKLLLSLSSSTSLLASTVMRNAQSGSKQPGGIGNFKSMHAPSAKAGVGTDTTP